MIENIIWTSEVENPNSLKVQEQFYFGDTQVHLINPLYVDLKASSFDLYQELFNDLAIASRNYHRLEMNFNSLNVQKERIMDYLEKHSISDITRKSELSYTSISELKKGKRTIDKLSVDSFEKLYRLAIGV